MWLTNMSTDHIILALEGLQPPRLVRFLPLLRGSERERRMLSVAPEVYQWLSAPAEGDETIQLKAKVKVRFGEFVKGEHIDDCDYLKRVSDRRHGGDDFSAEVWSLR